MENMHSSNFFSMFSDKHTDNPDHNYQSFVKSAAKYHFQLKAVIHDITKCNNSMEKLNELNETGRMLMTNIRDLLEKIDLHAKETGDQKFVLELESQRNIQASLIKEFKEANINKMLEIEKSQRENLLRSPDGENSSLRLRKSKVDQNGLLKVSTGVTEQLLTISRQLAATTQRSQDTLDNLVSSSSTVQGTQSELEHTSSTIQESGKLLKKYGRREFTDKVIMFFAFLFFLAVCLYIVQKRLF
ncbi:vesicle transport protein SEC20 [Leptidea sinapis]|uniref:vesicle transport protein SEC20 n=1 Tax=Leptidea sinapis TaxID=189913 RepID=UPI0021C49B78|nr:vesicle transport protein SEC20 [Leptidea sinapis]